MRYLCGKKEITWNLIYLKNSSILDIYIYIYVYICFIYTYYFGISGLHIKNTLRRIFSNT